MKMLTSVVFFTFAYCSMLCVLLPSLRRHPSVVRVRMVMLSLRPSDLPAAVINACVTIADTTTLCDRNDPAAIDDADELQDFQRRSSHQRVQVYRRRNRRRHRPRMCRMDWLRLFRHSRAPRSGEPALAAVIPGTPLTARQ
jgi:hypothetical protein